MDILLQPVRSARDREEFVRFPWQINKGDPKWVPPLLQERRARLDPQENSFWRSMDRELWIARRGETAVGTIAAFRPVEASNGDEGFFGFFECIEDHQAAKCLLGAAEDWVRARRASVLRGPFNPGENDEPGILVTGFTTRAAITQAHNPPYYPNLFEEAGYGVNNELVARLLPIPPGCVSVEQIMPERLRLVAERASTRKDLHIRTLDPRRWEEEIHLAWEIFNASLAGLPGTNPVSWEEFRQTAQGFRPILRPDLAQVAEIGGKPVGFALALPDINEAFLPLNGQLGLVNLARLWWRSRRLRRVSFKILVILPEFQGRGVEAVLIRELGRAILRQGFCEVDMSLTGENNTKSQRFQEHLGFQVYRRYRIYEKRLHP